MQHALTKLKSQTPYKFLACALFLTQTNSKRPKRSTFEIYLHQETGVHTVSALTGRWFVSVAQHDATCSNHLKTTDCDRRVIEAELSNTGRDSQKLRVCCFFRPQNASLNPISQTALHKRNIETCVQRNSCRQSKSVMKLCWAKEKFHAIPFG